MNYNEVARQLKDGIKNGNYNDVVNLLDRFINHKEIKFIEDKFTCLFDPPVDPVNYAINQRKEKIAIYLVEKAFSLNHTYWEDRAVCDEWCIKDHGPGQCPRQYDCSRNAEKQGMEALKLKIDSIQQGKCRPGEGISEPYIEKHMPRTPPPMQTRPRPEKNEQSRFIVEKKEKTNAEEAKEMIEKYGIRYTTKKDGTLLHMCVDKPRVFTYILANHGVAVNVQDKNRDTALHLAVRKGRLDIVEALVQCSADLSLRNLMGQTPVDEAEGNIKAFLKKFEPGVCVAVRDSHYNTLYRLHRKSWCSVHTRVKDNKSLLEWTQEKAAGMMMGEAKGSTKNQMIKESNSASCSFNVLCNYRPTSELIHAVLCEDAELARRVLWENKGLSVNVRFRDRIGKTLLCHAIEANNYELVKLLVDNGAQVAQVRVREHEQTDVTIPLYQKALRRDLDVNIVKLLQTILANNQEHEEKDRNGNTPLLRAIEENDDSRTINWLIKTRGGYSLLDRNKDGFTARELAHNCARDSVVKVIDRYILKELPTVVLRQFPVSFYSAELLNIVDEEKDATETGETLEQKMTKTAETHQMKAWVDIAQKTQNNAIELFIAAANGDINRMNQLNDANYQDKNGYTALTRAIVFNQYTAASELCIRRPALKRMGDNCGRYPLHYAYAMPEDQGRPFIRLILEKDAKEIENRVDKDGLVAAAYKEIRDTREVQQILYNARTLDAFGKRGGPLGPWPKGAETSPSIPEE